MTGPHPGATGTEPRPAPARAALARPAAVRRKVEEWLAKPDGAGAIALRARPARPATGLGIGLTTAWRYVREAVDLVAPPP